MSFYDFVISVNTGQGEWSSAADTSFFIKIWRLYQKEAALGGIHAEHVFVFAFKWNGKERKLLKQANFYFTHKLLCKMLKKQQEVVQLGKLSIVRYKLNPKSDR